MSARQCHRIRILRGKIPTLDSFASLISSTSNILNTDTLRKRAWPKLVGLHDLWEGEDGDEDDNNNYNDDSSVCSEATLPRETTSKSTSISNATSTSEAAIAGAYRPPAPTPASPYNLRSRKISQMPTTVATTLPPRRPPASPSRGAVIVTPEQQEHKNIINTRRKGKEKAAAAAAACFHSQDVSQIERDCARCTWHLLTGNQRTQRLQMEHKRNRKVSRLIQRKQNRLANLINWTLVQSYQLTAQQQQEQQQQTTYLTTIPPTPSPNKRGEITDAKNYDQEEKLHYYQGYHDVACIFLSTLGGTSSGRIPGIPGTPPLSVPVAASGLDLPSAVLLQVSQSHFRDCMRPNFKELQTAMRLALMPLIAVTDPDVHAHLFDCDMQPFFCLSWILTWFAHDIRDTAAVKRLFDVFLVSHPLMPMYMSVAMVVHPLNRKEVLATENDFADVHQTLQGLPKNSNMVGFKYRPGDGYVSDDEEDEDGTLSTGATSLDDADFFVEQGGGHLDDDGHYQNRHHTVETPSFVSTALSSCEPPAKVPFQELIDNSVKLMQRYPPRTLVALATRYYGQEQVNHLLAEATPGGIRMMEAPPAWASTPTAKADWVLKQRARERRGLSAKTRRDRRRENKRARSRSRSRGASITRSQGGSEREKGTDAASDETSSSLNNASKRGRGSGAAPVLNKSTQKYLADNSHTVPVIAIGHGTGDDGDRRRRKRRRFAMMGVAAVTLAAIVAGVVIHNRQDVDDALLPKSGEPAASVAGETETSRKMTSATGTSGKKQPIERVSKDKGSSSNRSRAEKTPVEQAPRPITETRVPQPVVREVSMPKVTFSSATTNIPVPPVPAARKSLWTSPSKESEASKTAVDQEATDLTSPHDDNKNSHPLFQLGQWTGRAVGVLSKRVDSGLTKLINDPRLVSLQPILQFSQRTGRAVRVIRKRVATGLMKLSDNPRLAMMRQWTGGAVEVMWKRAATELAKLGKMVHDAPTVNHVGKALKDAYDSPGGQEVACALQDASILSQYGRYQI